MRSVACVYVVPHRTGLAGDVATPVVLAVTAVVCASGVGSEAPTAAHDATPVHTLRAGVAPSEGEKGKFKSSFLKKNCFGLACHSGGKGEEKMRLGITSANKRLQLKKRTLDILTGLFFFSLCHYEWYLRGKVIENIFVIFKH